MSNAQVLKEAADSHNRACGELRAAEMTHQELEKRLAESGKALKEIQEHVANTQAELIRIAKLVPVGDVIDDSHDDDETKMERHPAKKKAK